MGSDAARSRPAGRHRLPRVDADPGGPSRGRRKQSTMSFVGRQTPRGKDLRPGVGPDPGTRRLASRAVEVEGAYRRVSRAGMLDRARPEDSHPPMHTVDDTPSDPSRSAGPTPPGGEAGDAGGLIRPFVEHWGMMARSWGINASMGELFALLYVTGTDWTAEELRERLQVSRGNVSMNLRELMTWGVVHKVHRPGERREFYRAEDDVWTLFRRILAERKRRELDPTLHVLERSVAHIPDDPGHRARRQRLVELHMFFSLINTLATRLLTLDAAEVRDLGALLGPGGDESGPPV